MADNTKTVKRKLVGRASDYFEDQLRDLDIISAASGISRAMLLRQGADLIIKQNAHYLSKKA